MHRTCQIGMLARCMCVWGGILRLGNDHPSISACIHDVRAASTERIVHVRAQRQIPIIMDLMPIMIQTLITSLLTTSRVHFGVDLRPPNFDL